MALVKSLEDGNLDVDIKFEEYEAKLQAKSNNALPFSIYPPSVLNVQTIPRVHRTSKASVPEGIVADTPHMKDLLHVFTTDWTVVNKNTYPAAPAIKEPELVDQVFEIDQNARTGSAQTMLDGELLQPITVKSRQANRSRRTLYDRKPIFYVFPMIPPAPLEVPHFGNPFFPIHSYQFHVRAVTMSMHLGDVEPFYGELFVYDLANKEAVTERFHFDCNADSLAHMAPQNPREPRDSISKARQAVFRISNPSPNLYLVLHITKTIRGDPDDTTEMYFKVQSVKQKEKTKFMSEAKEAVGRLGALKQSFAWGAVQLFSPTGQPCVPMNLKLNNIARSKGDLASYLSKVNDDREVKKMKLVPCDCTFEIKMLETEIPYRLDPSLLPVLPSTDRLEGVDIIREVQEFDTENNPAQPFTSYVHHLYFYPRTLNFTNYKSDKASSARNLCCEVKFMEDDTNVNGAGQPCIFGNSTTASISRSGWSTVVYHNKKPKWTDEIKIRLPPLIKPLNHLLVTFYHVSCRPGKKQADSVTPLGYCAIRLINAGGEIIIDDKYTVPVASVFPPKYFELENRENLLRWVDNKKGVFTYKTRLVSTISTEDPTLHSLYTNLSTDPPTLQQQLALIKSVHPRVRVQHMVTLITVLLRVICDVSKAGFNRTPSATVPASDGSAHIRVEAPTVEHKEYDNNLQKEEIIRSNPAVEAMLSLLDTLQVIFEGTAELEYLESYVTYFFSNQLDLHGLHAAIVSIWIFLLDEKHESAKELAKFSWFLFRLISKSLVLELRDTGKLHTDPTRRGRFSEFTAQLYLLTGLLATETQKLARSSLILAKSFNTNIAHFMSDILDIGDRGEVFRLIDLYVRKLDPANESYELVDLKFAFLRVLSFHEFYIALNAVIPPVIPAVSDIFSVFFKQHFLVGLLLAEVGGCIRVKEKETQMKAIITLRDQLYRHDHDPHLQDPVLKERLAAAYFPFIPLVLDNWTTLQKLPLLDVRDWLICFLYILKGVGPSVQSDWLKKETPKRKLNFFDLLTFCVKAFEYRGREESKHIATQLRHSSTHYFQSPNSEASGSENRGHSVRKEIKSAIFKHRSKHSQGGQRDNTKQILESYYANSPGNSSPLGSSSGLSPQGSGYRKRTKSSASITSPTSPTPASPASVVASPPPSNTNTLFNEDPVHIAKQSANLSTEVSMIVLSSLMQYFADHLQELTRTTNDFLEASFNTLVTLLRTHQSQNFLGVLFGTLPEIIEDFKLALFKHTNTLCGEITYELMKHCQADKLVQNRSAAAACLFLMLYTNNQTVNNVLRMKLQATIGISKLVGERIDQDFDYIRGCLEAIAKHIKTNVSKVQTQQGLMSQQMDELNERLFGVIRDSLKIKHHLYDPEITAELYSNISHGFMESPDLRVTWLHSLANFHKQHNNWEETAQTLIMTAALVMEYLKILNRFPVRFPADFESVFPNIKDELTLPNPALLTSLQNEICLAKVFTEQGFIGLIKEAIGMQKLGLLYESSVATYRLLLPIHQHKRNWVMQAECHMDLAHLCQKIVEDNKASARIFSNYYRVALYGQELIAASHGCEFIYKESNATRLADLSDRLMKQFGDKFGEDKVHLLPNKPVDLKTLNTAHIYIQIVAVDPYLTTEQAQVRISPFEQNFNINSFIFEIPFTKSGKAHGDMAEQYKRKTILVVDGAFPHVKKRLKVIEKREIEVPPIENAIEIIDKKAVQLGQQLQTAQPNSKTLQIILQGALLLQVNAGPLEICRLFLSDEAPKNTYAPNDVARLTATMKEFAQSLGAAVKLNAKMVDANDQNQITLQEQLVIGYKNFASKIMQYVPNIEINPDLV